MFTFIGVIVVLIAVHEVGHIIDYKLRDSSNTVTEFCAFGYNDIGGGWVNFESDGMIVYEQVSGDEWKKEIFPNILMFIVMLMILTYYYKNG